MSFFCMSGGARLLYIVRRAYVLHNDESALHEVRQIAARLIGAGCEPQAADITADVMANAERSGACPQRSEDSRRGTPLVAFSAINFGEYDGAGTTSVPVGNTGTTFTGQGL